MNGTISLIGTFLVATIYATASIVSLYIAIVGPWISTPIAALSAIWFWQMAKETVMIVAEPDQNWSNSRNWNRG